MTTSPLCPRPASPASSGRGRRSARSPNTCGRTPGRATSVGASADGLEPTRRAHDLVTAARDGDRRALARLLTAIENRTALAEPALRELYPQAGTAHIVGITGPPGAGKSTLVAAL